MSVALVILAAGKGTRIGGVQNKVWIELDSKPLWQYCLEVFLQYDVIEEIYWVCSQVDYPAFENKLSPYKKVKIVIGGQNRQESSYQGVQQIEASQFQTTLIHDAARAFCPNSVVSCVLEKCRTAKAVVPVIPMQDTIRQMSHHQSKLLDRNTLFAVQTPQGFDTGVLKHAHQVGFQHSESAATDDASLVERVGVPIIHAEGSPFNLKITTHYDLKVAQCFLQNSV